MFNTPEQSKFIVFEVGMNKKGEIDNLTKLIQPNLGLITNISYAHIKNFKNLNQIAKAKGEIINNIISNGTMIINMDDKFYKYFLKKTIKKRLKKFTFSRRNHQADIILLDQKKNKNSHLFKIKIKGIVKNFIISKELSSYKENILACLSIIANYLMLKNLEKTYFKVFVYLKAEDR